MGDRVFVRLTVLDRHADQARKIFKNGMGEANSEELFNGSTEFEFNDVNHGNLGDEKKLLEAGIPYDKYWEQGGEFDEGNEYLRFTDAGEPVKLEVYVTGKNPDLVELMHRIDQPDELRSYIVKHHEAVTPLPWSNQERNAKRYLARQLISE